MQPDYLNFSIPLDFPSRAGAFGPRPLQGLDILQHLNLSNFAPCTGTLHGLLCSLSSEDPSLFTTPSAQDCSSPEGRVF